MFGLGVPTTGIGGDALDLVLRFPTIEGERRTDLGASEHRRREEGEAQQDHQERQKARRALRGTGCSG
jgi:hypothetical protein